MIPGYASAPDHEQRYLASYQYPNEANEKVSQIQSQQFVQLPQQYRPRRH